MAYDKRPGKDNRSGGYQGGGQKGGYGRPHGGERREGGYRSTQGAKRTESGYRKTAQGSGYPGQGAPAQGRQTGARQAPQRNYVRDNPYDGNSTRPGHPGRAQSFFERDAAHGAKPHQSSYRPMGPGPRRAAPANRPVPPAVQDAKPSYPFKRQPPPVRVPASQLEPGQPSSSQPSPGQPSPEIQDNLLVGRNPIREAIKSGRAIDKLLVAEGDLSGSARQIVAWAREAHIVVQYVDRARLDQIYPNHQGMVAYAAAAEYSSLEAILEHARSKGEPPFVVVLDSITDPHNLGAIIRTAECAGAHGVIIPERRSAGLNPAAVKAAAGACEYQRIAKVVNLSRTLQQLKEEGLWIIGADMQGEPVAQADLSGPIALVIGSEGEGISNLVLKQCDMRVALPIMGRIDSLNASVAAGVLMYEVLRARAK